MKNRAIICSECGEDTFVRREPVYEGFTKTGEKIICVSCRHVYADDAEVPYKKQNAPKIFSDADRSKKVEIFHSDEKGHNCRHCDHYVTNPFVQRCGLHNREVDATDLCDDFVPKKETAAKDPLAELLAKKKEG